MATALTTDTAPRATQPPQPQPRKSKIENLQGLRGIAVLLVLFYHLGKYEPRIFTDFSLLPTITFLGRAGVDLFFVISGVVMVTITAGQFQKPGSARSFLLRRVARIYPVYWFYSLLYLPIFLYRPELMSRLEGVQGVNLGHSFLLLPSSSVPLVGQGWTLIHEMYFYAAFTLILLRPEKDKMKLLGLWALFIVGSWCLVPTAPQPSPTWALVSNPLTLEFLAGGTLAWLVQRGETRGAMACLWAGTGLFLVTGFLPFEWHRVLLYLVPASLLAYGAVAAERRQAFQFPRWLRFVGDMSYSLYLSHTTMLSLLKKVFALAHLHAGLGFHCLFIGVGCALCLGLGALSYCWVEKPLLRWAYLLVAKVSPRPLASPQRPAPLGL